MRITNQMLTDGVVRNLAVSVQANQKIQEQVATGKRLVRPSDDPADVRTALTVREGINEIQQYQRNVDSATQMVGAADTALGSAGDAVQRARELAIQGANDSNGPSDRQMMSTEVQQLIEELVQAASTKTGDRYIFSGFRTGTPPYEVTGSGTVGPYQGDSNQVFVRIDPSTTMPVNVAGDTTFAPAIAALSQLYSELSAGTTVSAGTITAIDTAQDTILGARATIGARANRLEATGSALQGGLLASQTLQSQLEDVDMTSAISELSQRQLSYQAALKVTGMLLQTSLIDDLT